MPDNDTKTSGKFGTVINCMDGRVQEPVTQWLKEKHQLDYVDVITEAGPDKMLATEFIGPVEYIKNKVEISVSKHGSQVIAIAGHHDCAGNPVTSEEHCEHIKQAVAVLRSWNFPVTVHGLWVDEHWQVHVVSQ